MNEILSHPGVIFGGSCRCATPPAVLGTGPLYSGNSAPCAPCAHKTPRRQGSAASAPAGIRRGPPLRATHRKSPTLRLSLGLAAGILILLAALTAAAPTLRAEDSGDALSDAPRLIEPHDSLHDQERAWRMQVDEDLGGPPPVSRYFINVETKLVRGTANLLTAPADLLACTVQAALGIARNQALMTAVSLPVGMTEGAQHSTQRAVSGAADIVTFWLPEFDSVDAPRSYFCQALQARPREP